MELNKREVELLKKLIQEQAGYGWQRSLTHKEAITLGNLAYKLGLPVG